MGRLKSRWFLLSLVQRGQQTYSCFTDWRSKYKTKSQVRSSNKCNVQATSSSGCLCKCKSVWGGGRLTFVMGVQEQVRRISDKDALVAVLEKGSVCTPTNSSLLIWAVRGQSGVGSPSTRLVLMWLASVLLLPIVAKRPRLPYIWMVCGVALSLAMALVGSLHLGVQHMMSPLLLLSLSP